MGWGIRQRQPRKEVALELGNSTPVIVEADADLETAATKLAASGFTHAGQSCISVQRVYVQRGALDRFRDLFVEAVRALKVGDPSEPDTVVGPIINRKQLDTLLSKVARAREEGARPVVEGDVRGQLETAMKEATVYANKVAKEDNDKDLQTVKKTGKTQVTVPTAEERLAF